MLEVMLVTLVCNIYRSASKKDRWAERIQTIYRRKDEVCSGEVFVSKVGRSEIVCAQSETSLGGTQSESESDGGEKESEKTKPEIESNAKTNTCRIVLERG